MGLQEYLSFCVGALERLVDFAVVHVVMGNEACDLDSVVSAVTYAYFLHETSTAPVGTALFLPFLNIPRSDFPLRTEVTHFLGKFDITAARLIFRDDLDLGKVKVSTDLKVTLVDHHVLSPAMSALGLEDNVVQILDHRPKDGDLPDRCDSTLELVGSCTTLIAEVALSDDTFPMDTVTATLLYGTIVTDTINFSPAAAKTTPKDLDLAQQLEAVIGPEVDRDGIFQEIREAKFDLSGLSCREVLVKDLKLVSGDSLVVAMSSVTMDMKALMGREDFAQSLKSFAAEKKVDAVVIMTLSVGPDDDVMRQLGVFSPSRVYRQQMADVLNTCHDPSLGLSPLPCSCPEEFLPFVQANTAASRKQVLPIVKAFLAGETTPDEAQLDVAYGAAGEAGMVRDESENFTTSLSGMVELGIGRQDTFDGEITSEDLTSRDNSTEVDLSSSAPEDNTNDDVDGSLLLSLPGDGGGLKGFFDPLSSVHSSDSGAVSPTATDSNRNAPETQLPAAEEVEFDALGGREAAEMRGSGDKAAEEAGDRVNFFLSEDSPSSPPPSQDPGSQPTQQQQQSQEPSETAVHVINNSNNNASGDSATTTTITNNNDHHHHHLADNPDPGHHNGVGEVVDGLEEALLNMASPHDLLFPAVDSPLDLSAAPSGQGSGVASGQTSGHASKQPSYPVTPPNSYMDLEGGGGLLAKETHLPSFNSSEMVTKIQEKKAALSARGNNNGNDEGEGTPDSTLSPFSPFTPQNSYAETGGGFPPDYPHPAQRHTQLPSFHSSDMVERIREKRSSMERDLQGAGMLEAEEEGGAGAGAGGGADPSLLAVAKSPFTPHNSFVDASLERYAHENLPSLNSAEITNKIRQKQAELAEQTGTEDAGGPGVDCTGGAVPFIPVSSYQDRPLDGLAHRQGVPDLNEVAERLSLTGSESSGSLSDSHGPLPRAIRPSNRVHLASPKNSGEGFPEGSPAGSRPAAKKRARVVWEDDDDDDEDIADEEEDETGEEEDEAREAKHPSKRKGVSFMQLPSPEGEGGGAGGGEAESSQDSEANEAAIQKIAYELANEMIQRALETFPAGSVQQLVPSAGGGEETEGAIGALKLVSHPSISEDSSPTMDESDQDISEEEEDQLDRLSPGRRKRREEASDSALTTSSDSERLSDYPPPAGVPASGSLADELAQAVLGGGERQGEREGTGKEAGGMGGAGVAKSESYEIETEYLSEMDPMHCVHSPTDIIQTDADREVVEGASFRKISGQEYQTVQNEILEEIRQEARERDLAKLRQSSFTEEDLDNDDLVQGSPDDQDAAAHGATEAEKRRITAEVELNLDESLTAEDGKKTIHVTRDRELYASALENVNLDDDDDDEEVETTATKNQAGTMAPVEKTLQPSNTAHPLMDTLGDSRTEEDGEEESGARKKIPASGFVDQEAAVEKQHRYESFAEASGMLGREEEVGRKAAVARTVSGTSDSSAAGSLRGVGLKGAELQDEWQDDELPNIIGAESQALAGAAAAAEASRKRLMPDHGLAVIGDSLENVAVVDSDSEIDSDIDNEQLEWETRKLLGRDDTPVRTPTKPESAVEEVPEYTAQEERRDLMHWKMINIGDGDDFRLDMKVIEPYKRVLSHGGYYGDRMNAMVVFSACYLPSRDRKDYSYVMNHLFYYMIHTLDELVADDYMIVYFHGATPRRQMPSFNWLKRCYQGIDRRLKKNLKALFLVHPTLWLKTVVLMTRPFISAKFSSKLQFVRTLADLKTLIPMEYVYIPDIVQRLDRDLLTDPSLLDAVDAQDSRRHRKEPRRATPASHAT